MKRNKMSGMIAVVALLLIGAMSFIACPTDAGDGEGTPTPPPTLDPVSLGDFSALTGNLNDNLAAGYWASSWWAAFETRGERKCASFIGTDNGYGAIGRNELSWDISGLTSLSLWIYADTSDETNPADIGTTYNFGLEVGAVGEGLPGVIYNSTIEVTEEMDMTWVKVTIPLSNFKDEENNVLSSDEINGWRIVRPVSTEGGVISFADIIVSE